PAFAAASMIELPAGTETSIPSIVRVTLGPSRGGVPTSTLSRSSRNSDHMMGNFLLSHYAAKRLTITSIRLLSNCKIGLYRWNLGKNPQRKRQRVSSPHFSLTATPARWRCRGRREGDGGAAVWEDPVMGREIADEVEMRGKARIGQHTPGVATHRKHL